MLTIYGIYRSRASRVLWLAGELGLTFRHVPVVYSSKVKDLNAPDAPFHSLRPEYLAINPNGAVPAISDDGLNLSESLAINLYLAKKHGGPLAPADLAEDGLMTMWSLWAATSVEPHSLDLLRHRADYPSEKRDEAKAVSAAAALKKPFAVLDEVLSKSGFLVAGRFTVADINVAEIVRYALIEPPLIEAVPHVRKWIEACHARPAFKAMMERRLSEA